MRQRARAHVLSDYRPIDHASSAVYRLDEKGVIPKDLLELLNWHLATHARFWTEFHVDSDGLCTHVHAQHGCKVWVIAVPKTRADDSWKDRQARHKTRIQASIAQMADECRLYCVYLQPHVEM